MEDLSRALTWQPGAKHLYTLSSTSLMVGTNSLGIPVLSKSNLQYGMKIAPRVRPAFGLPAGVTKHKYPLDIHCLLGLEEPVVPGTLHLEPAGEPAGSTVGVPGTWIVEKSREETSGMLEGESFEGGAAAGLDGPAGGAVLMEAFGGGAVELSSSICKSSDTSQASPSSGSGAVAAWTVASSSSLSQAQLEETLAFEQ